MSCADHVVEAENLLDQAMRRVGTTEVSDDRLLLAGEGSELHFERQS